ncbi:MAG: hypothetical protein DCO97_14900 [Marivita sp. XM-24bin2]|nr:MAG: hypothetical protein DCO97_14900 [Marivita sp. XM-24bin2]
MKAFGHREPRTTLLALLAVMLLFPGMRAAAQTPPELDLTIDVDNTSGAFSAVAILNDPVGDVVLPRTDWLGIEAIKAGNQSLSSDILAEGIILGDVHDGRDLRVIMSGRLPAPAQEPAGISWTPETLYAIGASWFPTDDLAIRSHYLSVTIAASHRIAATGTLVADATEGAKRRVQFAFTGRSEDLAFFGGPYVLHNVEHGRLALRTFFESADSELSERYLGAVADYVDRYERVVGAYPYDGFSVVSAPIPVGLGFAGLTYVSRDILRHPYMTGRSLAHEVLHSWWGNAVAVDYASGNWAEGLTTFQADYALAEEQGSAAARDMRIGWIRDLARRSDDRMQPLTAFQSSSQAADQSEGYGKAALVFHMLRDEIGAEAFSDGIRIFYDANRNKIAGWADLRAGFEAGAGNDLGWFFDQWVTRAGLPRIRITEAAQSEAEDSTQVALTIRQDAPAYRLRVPLIFKMTTGQSLSREARIEGEVSNVQFALPAPALSVTLDPDFDLARYPLDRELAPIIGALSGADRISAVDASGLGKARRTIESMLKPLLGERGLDWDNAPTSEEGAATLIVGLADDVTSWRPTNLGPIPDALFDGRTRLWVEQDAAGRLWAFLSLEDMASLAEDLRAVRYYTGQSYVAFEAGRAVARGVWIDNANAAAVHFDHGKLKGDVHR